MPHTILITGATGTVGSELVLDLANRGVTVRAGVHSIIKGDRLRHIYPDTQLVEIDYARPATLHVALTGVERLFLATPFVENQVALAKQVIDVAKQAGVQQIVRLSVAGADATPGIQLGRWHREVEEYLEQSGIPYTFVRPNSFMQNFVNHNSESICQEDKFYLPLGNGAISYVDVRDIASVAANILTADIAQHQSKAYTLTGPAALTGEEVAAAISQATGRPIAYVDVPEAAARQAMSQAPQWMTDAMLELHALGKAGHAAAVTSTVEELAGRPAYTFEQFAQDYHQHFQPAS
ncbi:SDR family oxidoreductase [Hymenobacter sp. GOD-10R]|uniref:SDR family oxidoreductase n=1 Tax=Hymenobacter sp. GOD-10R TaxID=3093922 RepID=UPI002D76E428|nr:SDR family oxidoreductase [Hymenobacter sp. GOD-10R]WRQ29610.1 SDR family oxidoreductase [Hymenobacter sp. GOD-10R]